MLENNRDEINYHKFLKSVRKSQGASLEKTGFGVYAKSGMSRVEAGTRLPDKLVRDRLTARLGISGEEYEEYLLPREYRQWQLRMEIISCINKKEIASAEEKIDTYKSLYDINSVEKQFIETMRYMIYEMKGYADEVLQVQIYNALICTVPDIDAAFAGVQLLADQELNLIMEYVRLTTPEIPKLNVTEWRLKEYNNIVTYVENSRMDKIAQAKVYSKLACLVSELILTEYATEDGLRYALELCTRAIEALRDTVRLYYFVELNEYRIKLIEKIVILNSYEKENNELQGLLETSREWAKLLCELYTENDLPFYMENFTYLYTETECNNISEVIRARRAMMGLTREKFCNNLCDERTVMRIEHEDGNPSMAIVRTLFDRVGLCAEYKRARVITSDAKALYLSHELVIRMNNHEHELAITIFNKLTSLLNMDIPHNEQEMHRVETMLDKRNHKTEEYELEDLFTDALECTLSLDSLFRNEIIYLTRTELSCVHDFAAYTKGDKHEKCKSILVKMSEDIMKNKVESSKLCVYELVINRVACIYGDEGRYKESNLLTDILLKECLQNRRIDAVIGCIYNSIWNYQQECMLNNIQANNDLVYKLLQQGYKISILTKNTIWKQFFQQKIIDLENN